MLLLFLLLLFLLLLLLLIINLLIYNNVYRGCQACRYCSCCCWKSWNGNNLTSPYHLLLLYSQYIWFIRHLLGFLTIISMNVGFWINFILINRNIVWFLNHYLSYNNGFLWYYYDRWRRNGLNLEPLSLMLGSTL